MIFHRASGPTSDGKYHVIYETAGCSKPTSACECTTLDQAMREAKRLNDEGRAREKQEAEEISRAKFYRIRFKHDRS